MSCRDEVQMQIVDDIQDRTLAGESTPSLDAGEPVRIGDSRCDRATNTQ